MPAWTLFASTLLMLGLTVTAHADDPAPQPLWPDGAPEAHGVADADRPTLTPFLPASRTTATTAVVVCPGGGYEHLSMEKEGFAVARWLNGFGVAAFVLRYRLGGDGYRHPVPLHDAQRAIRTVRARAAEWGIDPQRVGILGFSAGGHLASTAGTHFDDGLPDASDPIDRPGCRPDFMILIYPVISMKPELAHAGSRNYLLGDQPDPALVQSLSNDTQVTSQTAPTFLVHGGRDRTVKIENSIRFYQALRAAGVPAEMHLFETGVHGFGLGLAAPNQPFAKWPDLCAAWLRGRGLLPPIAN